MQVITNWLKGHRNFIVGRTIYRVLGHDEQLKTLLNRGQTPFAARKLAEALEQMLQQKPVMLTPAAVKETGTMPDSTDPVLLSIKNEWLPLYQRMNYLRHRLDEFGSSNTPDAVAARHSMAKEILQLEQQNMAIWSKRDFYIKNGKLPGVEAKPIDMPEDPLQIAQLINNLKRNIRRTKQAIRENPGKPHYVQLLEDHKQKYQQVTGTKYG